MAEEYVANGFSKCSGKKEKILLISRLHYVNIAAVGLPFVERVPDFPSARVRANVALVGAS